MEGAIRGLASIGLIAAAAYQIQKDNHWWFYVPSYALAAVICFIPFPKYVLWRFLSAVSVTGGGMLMLFLWWTFTSLENENVGFLPSEAKNLLPVAIGVALSCLTRLSTDSITKPAHLVRSILHVTLLAISLNLIITTARHFRY